MQCDMHMNDLSVCTVHVHLDLVKNTWAFHVIARMEFLVKTTRMYERQTYLMHRFGLEKNRMSERNKCSTDKLIQWQKLFLRIQSLLSLSFFEWNLSIYWIYLFGWWFRFASARHKIEQFLWDLHTHISNTTWIIESRILRCVFPFLVNRENWKGTNQSNWSTT